MTSTWIFDTTSQCISKLYTIPLILQLRVIIQSTANLNPFEKALFTSNPLSLRFSTEEKEHMAHKRYHLPLDYITAKDIW